jgi:hypothetical protein
MGTRAIYDPALDPKVRDKKERPGRVVYKDIVEKVRDTL